MVPDASLKLSCPQDAQRLGTKGSTPCYLAERYAPQVFGLRAEIAALMRSSVMGLPRYYPSTGCFENL